MSDTILSIALIVGAYLIGSVPSAYVIGRTVAGIDIREYGSGNVGASNVSVHVGKKWVAPIALFDVFVKGLLPVYVGGAAVLDLGAATQAVAGLTALCGHNWSIFLKFSGGRGISVGIGSIVGFGIPLFILWAAIPGILFSLTPWRDSAVGWLIATLLLPIWALWAGYGVWVAIYGIGFVVITIIRRTTSGGFKESLLSYGELTPVRLIWNRMVFDRDIASRDLWVHNRPDETT